MQFGRRALGSVLVAVALAVAGCSSAPSGSPTDTVKEVFRLIEAGQPDKIADLACAESKDKAAQTFDFAGALAGSLPPGLDAEKVADAVDISTSGLTFTEESRTDKAAVVRVKGTVKIAIDAEKFKPILKTFLEQSGLPVDDATIAAALDQMSGILSSEQPMDTTADVVNEGGSWKICE